MRFPPGWSLAGWFDATLVRHILTSMMLNFRIRISGPLPKTAVALLSDRFQIDEIRVLPVATQLTGAVVDQPELRALLCLVWDLGGRLAYLDVEATSRSAATRGAIGEFAT
jgi:hypothetical protein